MYCPLWWAHLYNRNTIKLPAYLVTSMRSVLSNTTQPSPCSTKPSRAEWPQSAWSTHCLIPIAGLCASHFIDQFLVTSVNTTHCPIFGTVLTSPEVVLATVMHAPLHSSQKRVCFFHLKRIAKLLAVLCQQTVRTKQCLAWWVIARGQCKSGAGTATAIIQPKLIQAGKQDAGVPE